MLKARCDPLRLAPRQRQQPGSDHHQNRSNDDEHQDDEASQNQDRWPANRSPVAQLPNTPHNPMVGTRRDSSDVDVGTVPSLVTWYDGPSSVPMAHLGRWTHMTMGIATRDCIHLSA